MNNAQDPIFDTLSFDQAMTLGMSLADFERSKHFPGHSTFHLERMWMLAEKLDDVHIATPAVHVAGSKGKGSVSALITSILTSAGYLVGLYTSPHLHTLCERVRVGLRPVSREEYAALVARMWRAVESVERDGEYGGVTFFEMMTALAMLHFRNVGADVAVYETGLGGRLDATNIVSPEVSVITSISIDHAATLGDTIEKIATEKAGIIKPGIPVVVAPQAEPDAMRVFERVAAERGSELISVDERFERKIVGADLSGQTFELRADSGETRSLSAQLLGDYQLENVACAVAAVEVLRDRGFPAGEDAIARGVSAARWAGRFETRTRDGKRILIDGAHNPYSVGRLVATMGQYFSWERVALVFGALGGHSAEGMLQELSALDPQVIAVQSRHPRSARASKLGELVRGAGMPLVGSAETVGQGLRRAIELAGSDDLVLCAGSLAVAAEALEELDCIEPEIYPDLREPRARRIESIRRAAL